MKVLLVAAVVIVVLAALSRLRRRPYRSRQQPERQRMSPLAAAAGWLLVTVGVLFGLASFTTADVQGMLMPMRIAAVVLLVAGAGLLLAYRNFYVEPRRDEVAFRTVLGRSAVIRYGDITDYRTKASGGRLVLTVTAGSAPRLRVNLRTHDMTPLLVAIDFRRAHGRWPTPGEAVGA